MNAVDIARVCKRAYELREASWDAEKAEKAHPYVADRVGYTRTIGDCVSQAMGEVMLGEEWRGLIYVMVTTPYSEASEWWNFTCYENRSDIRSSPNTTPPVVG